MSFEDCRHALRRLWAQPARTMATVGMLAIAVGLTTAVFTVADALVLTPVPFRDAGRLTRVVMFNTHGGSGTVSPAVLRAWRDSGMFDAVEGVSRSTAILDSGSGPVAKRAARVTPGLFPTLGVGPIVGRGFQTSEGRAGTDDRVMLSEGLWRSAYGGDRAIIGKTVLIDGVRASIVGVMPASFRFPDWNTAVWRAGGFQRTFFRRSERAS